MAKAKKKKAPAKKAPKAKKAAPKRPAPKKKAAPKPRMTAKVSPLRGTSVDDWAKQKLTTEQQQILAVLLELIAEEAADAEHVIKWAQPVWELSGPFAYFKPSKQHVTFGFWRGAELDDPEGLLEGGDRMKHVKLRGVHEAKRPAIRGFVRHAASLNRAKGDPTRR